MVVILAALPWVIGRACGPVSGSRPARLLRTGGYAAVLALVLVKTAVRRVADAPPNNLGGTTSAWIGEVIFLAVMAGYATVILAATARRSPAVPAAVTAGTAAGTAIAKLTRRAPRVSLDSVRMSRHTMYYDASKAVRDLALPQTPVEEALTRAVQWFRDNGYVAVRP